MLAMNNTSSAIWASLAMVFAGCRVFFFWLKQYVFSGCVGILFCPFCHSCAWDVWTSTLTPGAGLHSWQNVYSSSLCGLVVGRKHAEGRNPVKEPVVLGVCQPRVPAFPLALGTLDFRALKESGGQCAQFGL